MSVPGIENKWRWVVSIDGTIREDLSEDVSVNAKGPSLWISRIEVWGKGCIICKGPRLGKNSVVLKNREKANVARI